MGGKRKPKGPGQYNRKGLTVKQLFEIVPDEQVAEQWFENVLWGFNHENRN